MYARNGLAVVGICLVLSGVGTGCISPGDILNPELISLVGAQRQIAVLPGDAPGLLVWVENRTDRLAEIVVSYRDGDDNIDSYTTYLNAGDKSGQMLVCPVAEITLGSVTDLTQAGARVALVTEAYGSVDTMPYMDVEAFGRLLQDGINYNCGDSLEFVVRPSSTSPPSPSGYQTIAFFRRASNQ
ncbi:MAG: hypothetical protein KAY37_04350 [Phycisphaerae bacterium]|nr:hypothetical protein [Phycisphaerae bacterium]